MKVCILMLIKNYFFSNFILLLDSLNVINTSLTEKVTCTWLAYND